MSLPMVNSIFKIKKMRKINEINIITNQNSEKMNNKYFDAC